VKEFIAKTRSEVGYIDYWFTKENQSAPFQKRGYAQLSKPFGWVVGSGYYL